MSRTSAEQILSFVSNQMDASQTGIEVSPYLWSSLAQTYDTSHVAISAVTSNLHGPKVVVSIFGAENHPMVSRVAQKAVVRKRVL
jgi:hypothetical protein